MKFNYLGFIKVITDAGAFVNDLGGKEGFDIEFDIEASADNTPTQGTVQIYNLTNATIDTFRVGQPIELIAGYRDLQGPIMKGTIHRIDRERDSMGDLVLRLYIDDYSYNFFKYRINKSYTPGTTSKTIINDIISLTGYKAGEIKLKKDRVYINGFIASNSASTVLGQVANDAGCKLVYEGAYIHVVPISQPFKQTFKVTSEGLVEALRKVERNKLYSDRKTVETLKLIEEKTGQKSDPPAGGKGKAITSKTGNVQERSTLEVQDLRERDKTKGVICSVFLRYDIQVGCGVQLDTKDVKGDYHVVEVRHYNQLNGSLITEMTLEEVVK